MLDMYALVDYRDAWSPLLYISSWWPIHVTVFVYKLSTIDRFKPRMVANSCTLMVSISLTARVVCAVLQC